MNQALRSELTQCLSQQNSFDLFFKFLAKEFSIECLLSYVELIEFKQRLSKRMDSKLGDVGDDDEDLKQRFPARIAAVESPDLGDAEDGDASVKREIHRFYVKYIRTHSEFEINVLDATRLRLTAVLGDYDNWLANNYYDEVGLFHFYDGCISEMR